jgi:hypothetical protein
MATRKIRLDLTGTQVNSVGAIVDIDFNGTNLDADLEIDGDNIIKEYTVDVDAGTYNLDITFKNDQGGDAGDRNFTINTLETANDGVNFSKIFITESNTTNIDNLSVTYSNGLVVPLSGRLPKSDEDGQLLRNPSFDLSQTRTDPAPDADSPVTYVPGSHEGVNAKYIYEDVYTPVTIYTNSTSTIHITFS